MREGALHVRFGVVFLEAKDVIEIRDGRLVSVQPQVTQAAIVIGAEKAWPQRDASAITSDRVGVLAEVIVTDALQEVQVIILRIHAQRVVKERQRFLKLAL